MARPQFTVRGKAKELIELSEGYSRTDQDEIKKWKSFAGVSGPESTICPNLAPWTNLDRRSAERNSSEHFCQPLGPRALPEGRRRREPHLCEL